MRKQFSKLALTASLVLAISFTLSCSSDKDDGNDGGNTSSPSGNSGTERWKEFFKYYDPDNEKERCQNGVVERICDVDGNKVWYSPLTHFCEYITLCSGTNCVTTSKLGPIEGCGNKLYPGDDLHYQAPNPNVDYVSALRCQGGVLERICAKNTARYNAGQYAWYNEDTQYCDDGVVKAQTRCGSKYYRPSESTRTRCQNEVLEEKCGGEEGTWYNPDTHYCHSDIIIDNFPFSSISYTVKPIPMILCGNEYIRDNDYSRCNNGAVEERCGFFPSVENPNWYNEITQSCNYRDGTVKNKVRCGG